MKKISIIAVNLLIFLCLWGLLEFVLYKKCFIKNYDIPRPFIQIGSPNNIRHTRYIIKHELYENSKKSPILLLGCSYTYGIKGSNQTFGTILSDKTKRSVYNWGRPGAGSEYVLSLIEEEQQNHILKQAPEYIIYTYMYNHLHRLGHWDYYDILRKNGIMDYKGPKFLYNSYIYSKIRNTQFTNEMIWDNAYELQLKIFRCIVQKAKDLFPNSKFVFLLYSDANFNIPKSLIGENGELKGMIDEEFEILNSEKFRKDLESLGATVISTEDLLGRKMDREDDRLPRDIDEGTHPSEKAWNEVSSALVKKLNL